MTEMIDFVQNLVDRLNAPPMKGCPPTCPLKPYVDQGRSGCILRDGDAILKGAYGCQRVLTVLLNLQKVMDMLEEKQDEPEEDSFIIRRIHVEDTNES